MASLSAFNGLQRLFGLGLTGMAIGLSYASLLLDAHTGKPQLRTAFAIARLVALATSILTFVVGLHMSSLTFSSTLLDYKIDVPEMGVYLVCTLLSHQLFFLIYSYLLAYRIKSIVPWAGNQPRFVPIFVTATASLLLIPSTSMIVAVAQTPKITDFLVNFVYNRVTKAALSIQTCILGFISVTTDITILVRLRNHRTLLYNGHSNAVRAIARINKQMMIVSVNTIITLIELFVRVVAVYSVYVGVDTYIKSLAIAVDIHTFCHMGVTIEDVLRMPASSSGHLNAGATVTKTVLVTSSQPSSNSPGSSPNANMGMAAMKANAKYESGTMGGAGTGMTSSFMHHALSSMTSAMFRSSAGAGGPSMPREGAAAGGLPQQDPGILYDQHNQPSIDPLQQPSCQQQLSVSTLHVNQLHHQLHLPTGLPPPPSTCGLPTSNTHAILAIDEEGDGEGEGDGDGDGDVDGDGGGA